MLRSKLNEKHSMDDITRQKNVFQSFSLSSVRNKTINTILQNIRCYTAISGTYKRIQNLQKYVFQRLEFQVSWNFFVLLKNFPNMCFVQIYSMTRAIFDELKTMFATNIPLYIFCLYLFSRNLIFLCTRITIKFQRFLQHFSFFLVFSNCWVLLSPE